MSQRAPRPKSLRRGGGAPSRASTALVLVLALIASLAGVMPVTAQQRLPDMGEPADTALSPREEAALGDAIMREIRRRLPLVRDVQVEEYVQALGMRLALASGKTDGQRFDFFVIEDEAINAFAIPGGHVGVNVGLIEAMNREEQLAAVLAHEVAHVTQRHHARAFATGNRASISAAATVVAAILIGQASPEAGQAALAAGLAATQQSAINFTRGNEIEADRIGIEILADARYDARAMAETFAIMRRRNTLDRGSAGLEYLRTHPLDNDRIAEAADRAVAQPEHETVPQTDFELFKARLAVLTTEDATDLESRHRARLAVRGLDAAAEVGSRYVLAALALRANRLDEAQEELERLDALAAAHPAVELLRAEVLEARGQSAAARARLARLAELYPERYSIVEKRLEQLVRARRLGEASEVARRYLARADAPHPLAWRQLAAVQQRRGDTAASHESLARYFEALDELAEAERQLELALRQVPLASQDELRLAASLKALRERAVRLR